MHRTNTAPILNDAVILFLMALHILVLSTTAAAETLTQADHANEHPTQELETATDIVAFGPDSDLIRATLLPGLLWSFLNGNAILAAHLAEIVIFESPDATKTSDATVDAPSLRANNAPNWRTALMAFHESPRNPVELSMASIELTNSERQVLDDFGWTNRVSTNPAIWVDVSRQLLTVIKNGEIQSQMTCATAKAGTGSLDNSNQTPLGWHHVTQKIGDDAPWGQVFRARIATDERWKPGGDTAEDLVLTRLIWLSGSEPGKNQGLNAAGQNVDSKSRFIYIHGTNDEARIGTPSSHGCIRLMNDDVITLFASTEIDTPVLITAQPLSNDQKRETR